jgi:hypothetical protein
MKKNLMNILILSIVSDNCGNEATPTLNTGGKKQCLPKPVQSYALARNTFEFASTTAARTKAAWDTAKQAKDIVIFWDVEEFAQANTEPTKKEGRFNDYPLKDGVRGLNLTHYLGDCPYNALESYDNSGEYTKMFRILTDGTFTADVQDDGKVKGENIKNFSVGVLNDATDETPQNAVVAVKFSQQTKSVLKPEFDLINYEGIYNVQFEENPANSATSLKFRTLSGCSGSKITSFVEANIVLRNASGVVVEPDTFVAADADGYYTLTGTGFTNGYTIELDGVVTQTGIMYDAPVKLTIANVS